MAENKETKKIKEQIFDDYRKTVEEGADIFTESTKKLNSKINKSISSVEKTLGKLGDGVLEKNKQLSQAYDEYKKVVAKQQEILNSISDATKAYNEVNDRLEKNKDKIDKLIKERELNNQRYENKGNLIDSKEAEVIKLGVHPKKNKEQIKALKEEINQLTLDRQTLLNNNEEIANNIVDITNENISIEDELISKKEELIEKEKEYKDTLSQTLELTEKITDESDKQTAAISRSNNAVKAGVKALNTMWGVIKQFSDKWIEIDNAVTKHNRSLGVSHAQSESYRKNVLRNYGEMASRLGMTFEEMFKFQEQYSKNTGRAILLTNKQVETLAGLSKIVGDVATDEMVKNMDDFGASVDTSSDYLIQNYARAAQAGLNASKTSEAFANNIKMASRYTFREGVNGVSRMTMLSERLKFNMQSISSAMDKFSSIEGSIEGAANLQLLGGAYANNFGNPLQMMSMALMDAEGFTQSIVDTFSNFAIFDREKGMADMSAFEKQRMKLAADSLGLNYDEVWNIASQSAKAREIDKEIGARTDLDEYNKEFLRNKAQFDVENQQFYVTSFEGGEEQKTYLSEITDNSRVDQIRQTLTKEDVLQKDVHQIRDLLAEYVANEVGMTKTLEEVIKGGKEQFLIGGARLEDPILTGAKKVGQGITNEGYGGLAYGIGTLGLGLLPSVAMFARGGLGGASGSGNPASTRMGTNNLLKWSMKGDSVGTKMLKGGSALGGAILIGTNIYDATKASKNYKNNIQEIQSSNLGYYEQQQAILDAKKERNKSYGKSAGSIIGGAIGAFAGPIGMGIGSVIGSYVGGAIGKSVTKNNSTVYNSSNSASTVSAQQVVGNQTHINNTTMAQNMDKCKITIEPLKIDLTGAIKLKGDKGGVQTIDASKLLADHDFVRQIKEIIGNEINKDIGERINKNTPYYNMGSSYQKYSNV